MRILAIDPGYERLGIAVLEKMPAERRERVLYSDCFKTSASLPFPERLLAIGAEIGRVIGEYSPEMLATETLFFSTNTKTAMKVAETRGVILYEAKRNGLAVVEFSPADVKIAVAGWGRGDKKQVIAMVGKLVEITKEIRHDDEYDAIAIGLTCFAHHRPAVKKSQ